MSPTPNDDGTTHYGPKELCPFLRRLFASANNTAHVGGVAWVEGISDDGVPFTLAMGCGPSAQMLKSQVAPAGTLSTGPTLTIMPLKEPGA